MIAEVPPNFLNPDFNGSAEFISFLLEKAHVGDLKNFTNAECITTYGTDYMTDFGNVLLVLDDFNTAGKHLSTGQQGSFEEGNECEPYTWMCPPGTCSCRLLLPSIIQQSSTWAPYGNKVAYCLAYPLPGLCKLQFSPTLLLIVTVMNLLKFIVMVIAAFGIRAPLLMTTGDAITSFLELPDAQTENMCLNSKEDFLKYNRWPTDPKLYSDIRQRWYTAVGGYVWTCLAVS